MIASAQKIPLLSLLAYIDITCQHLPSFTLHRFLIAGVCAGSKAQCDVFCTNSHYAKVGGIKVAELNALEREFLKVTQWALCVSDTDKRTGSNPHPRDPFSRAAPSKSWSGLEPGRPLSLATKQHGEPLLPSPRPVNQHHASSR
jgi:hypothetical protein